jgi:hypothetical protein
MPNQELDPTLSHDVAAAATELMPTLRPPVVSYQGFSTTTAGREYRLRVVTAAGPRLFEILIPHEAFASRAARYQDAPDLCFAKLQRELAADPDLLAGSNLTLSAHEFREYTAALNQRPPVRKRRPHLA